MIRFLATILGLTSPNSSWYLLWSGIGGNVLILIVALLYHRFTCSVPGCRRIGLHEQELTGHSFCRKHDALGQREREAKEAAAAAGEIPEAP